jgi:hypothetical protein
MRELSIGEFITNASAVLELTAAASLIRGYATPGAAKRPGHV